MSDETLPPPHVRQLSVDLSNPAACGVAIAEERAAPFLKAVMALTPESQWPPLFTAFIGYAVGAMAVSTGKDNAIATLRQLIEAIEKNPPPGRQPGPTH